MVFSELQIENASKQRSDMETSAKPTAISLSNSRGTVHAYKPPTTYAVERRHGRRSVHKPSNGSVVYTVRDARRKTVQFRYDAVNIPFGMGLAEQTSTTGECAN